jgi:hypothetical protein
VHARRAFLALLLVVIAGAAHARLLVKGKGKERVLVREQFSGAQLRRFDLFVTKCTRCHDMGRPIDALETGIAPVTGAPFDERSIRTYVIKMMRKTKSGIGKRDADDLIQFLRFARRLAQQPAAATPPPAGETPAPDAGVTP